LLHIPDYQNARAATISAKGGGKREKEYSQLPKKGLYQTAGKEGKKKKINRKYLAVHQPTEVTGRKKPITEGR